MFEEHRKVGATGAYLPVRRISGTDKDGGELRWEGERGRDKGTEHRSRMEKECVRKRRCTHGGEILFS